VRLVVQDHVEAEVQHRHRLGLLPHTRHGPGQGLALLVADERQQRRQAGAGGHERGRLPVVVLGADVHVAVDEPGEHVPAAGVDDAVGGRQQRLGTDGGDPAVRDRHRRLVDVRRRDHLAAADEGVGAISG